MHGLTQASAGGLASVLFRSTTASPVTGSAWFVVARRVSPIVTRDLRTAASLTLGASMCSDMWRTMSLLLRRGGVRGRGS